jgi:protein gp37
MSDKTNIQWCHSTVNPIMGCHGCELYPAPEKILAAVEEALVELPKGNLKSLLTQAAQQRQFLADPLDLSRAPFKLTTTHIYHFRELILPVIEEVLGKDRAEAVRNIIEESITCYAAKLHHNKAQSLVNPNRNANPGYAPFFEKVSPFPGRVTKMARKADLWGKNNPEEPWLNGLPRLIFVSDMGDAFSRESDFPFLKDDVMPAIESPEGKRHLWLWLTKRPKTMARFSKEIGGFPDNLCAMTTLTSADPAILRRVDQLREVEAPCRGLSIEPLWERIPAEKLDLQGIDWVILGGESGAAKRVKPFHLEWATELRDHCHAHGVAFFVKQLGTRPHYRGKPVKLRHSHGGDWNQWPKLPNLRLRQFPRYFYDYRQI